MKKKIRLNNIFIAFSYVLLMCVIPITIFFFSMIANKLGEHIKHTMKDSADLCTEMIERQYESDMLMLEGLAVRMATSFEDDPARAMTRLVSTAERYNMKRITFSFPDGSTLATDNAQINIADVYNFQLALAGESLLTPVVKDISDNENVNIYSLPVFHSSTGEILGVLSAVYQSENFENLLAASFFEGEGYTYIIDTNGIVVVNSHHVNAVDNISNLFSYIDEHNVKDADAIKASLQNAGEGFIQIDREKNRDFYAYYKKLNINDWYVVSVVPKAVAESTRIAVMSAVLVYCLFMSLISVIVIMGIRHAMREKNKLLRDALYVDDLTGGRSFEKFQIDCKDKLKNLGDKKAAFVFLDIDNFNLVSTLYGHDESEDTIRRVYAMINNCLGEQGIMARNSADQFCVIYFFDEMEEFEQSINRFVETLHDNAKFANMLRPSMGVYMIEDPNEEVYDMMNKARTAHETIKHREGTIVAYYDAGFRDMKFRDKHMEDEMESALSRHEFVPYLQPKYSAKTGEICGAEALIRWITPEGNIIPPGRFIPLAENNGFVRQLDKEMFKIVCQMQKKLVENGQKAVPVSVNVSRQLLYDKNFAKDYCAYINEIGISPDLVELEITESAFFEDIGLFRSTLETLRNFGFRILMDDFGTGYSSLMMLHFVPIDVMKLDKSFIDGYAEDKGSSIIQCVLSLAKQLQLPVVAEGVETEAQYIYLKDSGCDVIQGYYFSKPMPQEEYLNQFAC